MNKIDFIVQPSEFSNDHAVQILVDGKDLFQGKHIGLDPTDLFPVFRENSTGELLIGRCECGCVGCGDMFVDVLRKNDKVFWVTEDKQKLVFDEADYYAEVKRLIQDNSWEDINRRVERLVGEIFKNIRTYDHKVFDWASARIGKQKISLSFTNREGQRLLDYWWDGKTEGSAIRGAKKLFRNEFS